MMTGGRICFVPPKESGNTLYKKSIKIFCAATAAAAVLRALVKILFVDTETGFYIGSRVMPLLLAGIMMIGVAGIAFFALREKDETDGRLRGNRYLEVTSAALGIAIAGVSALRLPEILAIDPEEPVINRLPTWLLKAESILGIASGVLLLYITFCLLSGAQRSGFQGIVALVPVIWHSIHMVDRFISFREVSTVSDQFIETMYLVCATMFLLANARCLAATAKSGKRCVLWGLLTAHFGIVLTVGQICAIAVLGSDISGPDALQNALMLVLSCYAVTVACSMVFAADKE